MDKKTKRLFVYRFLLNHETGELREWNNTNDLLHATADAFVDQELVKYLWTHAYEDIGHFNSYTCKKQMTSEMEEMTQMVYALFGISYPPHYILFITSLCKQMDALLKTSSNSPVLSDKLREWVNSNIYPHPHNVLISPLKMEERSFLR